MNRTVEMPMAEVVLTRDLLRNGRVSPEGSVLVVGQEEADRLVSQGWAEYTRRPRRRPMPLFDRSK